MYNITFLKCSQDTVVFINICVIFEVINMYTRTRIKNYSTLENNEWRYNIHVWYEGLWFSHNATCLMIVSSRMHIIIRLL